MLSLLRFASGGFQSNVVRIVYTEGEISGTVNTCLPALEVETQGWRMLATGAHEHEEIRDGVKIPCSNPLIPRRALKQGGALDPWWLRWPTRVMI